MFFCRIIRGKSKLSVDHTVESHAFLQEKPWKVKTFRVFSCGKFQYTEENQNLPTVLDLVSQVRDVVPMNVYLDLGTPGGWYFGIGGI
jgi:hypothetical protein